MSTLVVCHFAPPNIVQAHPWPNLRPSPTEFYGAFVGSDLARLVNECHHSDRRESVVVDVGIERQASGRSQYLGRAPVVTQSGNRLAPAPRVVEDAPDHAPATRTSEDLFRAAASNEIHRMGASGANRRRMPISYCDVNGYWRSKWEWEPLIAALFGNGRAHLPMPRCERRRYANPFSLPASNRFNADHTVGCSNQSRHTAGAEYGAIPKESYFGNVEFKPA